MTVTRAPLDRLNAVIEKARRRARRRRHAYLAAAGHDVVWLEPGGGLRTPVKVAVSRIGLDPTTRRVIVAQSFSRGQLVGALVISQRPDLAAAGAHFVKTSRRSVPVTPHADFDPWSGLVYGYGFPAARTRNSL
jgi:hypothetical protein